MTSVSPSQRQLCASAPQCDSQWCLVQWSTPPAAPPVPQRLFTVGLMPLILPQAKVPEDLCTFTAPALRTISTIWLMVVPRTMESSTSSTFFPSNTAGMAFSFRRTLISRVLHATRGCQTIFTHLCQQLLILIRKASGSCQQSLPMHVPGTAVRAAHDILIGMTTY